MSKRSAVYYITLVCAVLCGAAASADAPAWWQPAPGTTWQWQLNGAIDTSYDVTMYDIDLFEAPQDVIDGLKANGRVVVCYFSAGSFERWRPDKADFPKAVKGKKLDGWPGEKWLDIRKLAVLALIMEARLDLAVKMGCDGVEPDNIDGFTNDTGFPLTYADQLTYNVWLAAEAHERGLSIGLKNDLEQVPDLVDDFDWMLNEQCYQYDECDMLLPFVQADKAVFGVEYREEGDDPRKYCPAAVDSGFSWLVKTYDLGRSAPNACSDYLPLQVITPDEDGTLARGEAFVWSKHAAGMAYRVIWTRLSNGRKGKSGWVPASACAAVCTYVAGDLKPGMYRLVVKTRWPGAARKPNSGKLNFTVTAG